MGSAGSGPAFNVNVEGMKFPPPSPPRGSKNGTAAGGEQAGTLRSLAPKGGVGGGWKRQQVVVEVPRSRAREKDEERSEG